MMAMLSDGRHVPVTLRPWAAAMVEVLTRLHSQPRLGDVGDLRKLMQFRPVHYLGRDWEQVIEQAGRWLDQAERALPAMPVAALQAATASEPLPVRDEAPVGCPA